jgi:membrane protease YdiL (CAAX protease family)
MRDIVRLTLGISMGLVVYLLAVRIVPSVGLVRGLIKANRWLSSGTVTQIVLFVLSLALIFIFGRGDPGAYGLRGIMMRRLLIPIGISVAVSLLLIVPGLVLIVRGGSPGAAGPGMDLLRLILTVWVLASICEEVFYRGLLQGFLDPLRVHGFTLFRRYLSLPVVVCALGFGLGHLILLGRMGAPMVGFIVVNATVLGLLAGYFREATGSIVPAIAVHMTFNVVGASVPMILMKILSR